MKQALAFALILWVSCAASAQSGEVLTGKLAIVSLIGDSMTIDTYRRRVGTAIDSNRQEVIRIATPVFDDAVIAAASTAVYPQLTQGSSVSTLAVPAPGSNFDPALLLSDGAVAPSNSLVTALRANSFTHLLAITKHRGIARLQMANLTVGGGHLEGIGFYIDHDFYTKRSDTGQTARGFIAPYAYLRLLLIKLDTLEIQGDRTITASEVRSAARNETGFDPWGAMTAEEKVSMLQGLLRQHVSETVPLLFRAK